MTCNDPNCDKAAFQRGYCQRHYMDFYRYGLDYATVKPVCGDCGQPTGGKTRRKLYCDSCARERIRCDRKRANNRRRSQSEQGDHYTVKMLLDLDGDACYLCREVITGRPSVDHVVPLSRGGSDTVSNVALTHWECNNRKRAKSLGEVHLEFPDMAVPERMGVNCDAHGN